MTTSVTAPDNPALTWAMALYRRSVLKQEKHRRIVGLLPPTEGTTCLDVGGDNGVISYLLRQRGGRWHSADLDEPSVRAIRRLVGSNVITMDDTGAPFADGTFDLVVIVDFLEHVHRDDRVVAEMARILRPGGTMIVNVPHLRPHSFLNWLRPRIGLTDERHGHVRPGYSRNTLRDLLGDAFRVEQTVTYSRTFSELVDTALNAALLSRERRSPSPGSGSRKGPVVTEQDWGRSRRQVQMLNLVYPMFWLAARADALLPWQQGYKLILRATRVPAPRTEDHAP